MEFLTLKAVALGAFAAIVAMQVIAGIWAVRRVNTKRTAERKLESALYSKFDEPEFRDIIKRMECELAAPRGDFDASIYNRLLEEITEAAKELKVPERREVLEGVFQPSQVGRERYMRKIVLNTRRSEKQVPAG